MAQNSAPSGPVYSNTNRQMLNSEPLPLMHFMVVTTRGKGVIFQKLTYVAIAFGVFIVGMQLVSLVDFDSTKLFRFPMTCNFFYITVALISLTFIIDIQKLLKLTEKYCWSLDSAGPEIRHEIFKFSRKEDLMAAIAILMLLGYERYMINFETLRRVDYTSAVLRQYLPSMEPAYLYALMFWLIVCTPMFLGWPFTYMYFSWHQQYQVLILAKYVKEISTDFYNYTVNGSLIDDVYYQEVISERLTFVIKRHVQTLRSHHELLKYLNLSVTSILLGISGMGLAVGSCWTIALDGEWFAPLMLFTCFGLFLEMIASSAQDYEDRFLSIYDKALQIPWFEFDIKNRQAYLLLVQISAQTVPYRLFNVQLNRAFQLRVIEKLYAIANILIHFYL